MTPINYYLACDWLDKYAGSERVIKAMVEAFPPKAVLMMANVMAKEDLTTTGLNGIDIHDTFLKLLGRQFRFGLPLFPWAIKSFENKIPPGSVILSSSHAVAKGISSKKCLHICYMQARNLRYVWDEDEIYPSWAGKIIGPFSDYLRDWDVRSAQRPNHLIANSAFVAGWIKERYNRTAEVIYPPVEVDRFDFRQTKDDYFIYAGRLVPYKRVDIIVKAFNTLPDQKLLIIGDGPQRKRLEEMAGANITFTGFLAPAKITSIVNKAKCFVNANVEDFGIALVEAQAAGCPVVAFGQGGAAETVLDGKTGLLFLEQSIAALIDAIQKFLKIKSDFDPNLLRENAQKFTEERFRDEFKKSVAEKIRHWEG